MRSLLMALLLLVSALCWCVRPLPGQAPVAKVVKTCGALALHPGQLTWVYVDSTGTACTLTSASGGANPAGGWLDSLRLVRTLDSLRAIAWMDSLKMVDSLIGIRGVVKTSLSAADSVQLRTGTKHAARVAVDSILTGTTHIGRVAVDSVLGGRLDSVSLAHVTLGAADSVQLRTGTKHAARVAVDTLLDSLKLKTGSAHVGAVNVDTLQASLQHSDSCVTGIGAKSAADSVLLPAVTSKRHYLTFLHVIQIDSATAIAGAIPDTVSTTNLPGPLLWKVGNALIAGGTNTIISATFTWPIRSITAATVTKIRGSAPGTGAYWSISACYVLGP